MSVDTAHFFMIPRIGSASQEGSLFVPESTLPPTGFRRLDLFKSGSIRSSSAPEARRINSRQEDGALNLKRRSYCYRPSDYIEV